jgi:hypothetical protein
MQLAQMQQQEEQWELQLAELQQVERLTAAVTEEAKAAVTEEAKAAVTEEAAKYKIKNCFSFF